MICLRVYYHNYSVLNIFFSIAKCQGSNVCNVTDGGNEGERYDSTDGSCDENCVDEDVDKEEREVVPLDQQQKWDCESVLSTYSNLFNHPTLIKDPPHRNFKVKVGNSW